MNDYDAEFVWDYDNSCHDFLEEDSQYDEDYARFDDNNYQELAYRHYAWGQVNWVLYINNIMGTIRAR